MTSRAEGGPRREWGGGVVVSEQTEELGNGYGQNLIAQKPNLFRGNGVPLLPWQPIKKKGSAGPSPQERHHPGHRGIYHIPASSLVNRCVGTRSSDALNQVKFLSHEKVRGGQPRAVFLLSFCCRNRLPQLLVAENNSLLLLFGVRAEHLPCGLYLGSLMQLSLAGGWQLVLRAETLTLG